MMKEVKRTKVPVPDAKKLKSKRALSNGALSKGFIGSDEESADKGAAQPKPTEKPKTTIGIHRPDGAVKTKEKPSRKDPAPPKPATKPTAPPSKKATPKQITQENVTELSSPDLSDDNEARPTLEIQTKPAGSEKETAAARSSDSDSNSDISSDESDVIETLKTTPKPAQARARASQPESHAVEFRPSQDYVPPKGFAPVPLNDRTISKAARLFDNLEGKQLWHVTVPAGISLKNLKEISMDKVIRGEAVLSHKDRNYGLATMEKSEEGAREVLIPQKNGYKALSVHPSQILHLQEHVHLPKMTSLQADPNTGSEAAASITRSTIRTPRPQVKGLKMRFLPIGFGNGTAGELGDSDSEEEVPQELAGLAMPNGLNLPSRKKEKRKHNEMNGDKATEAPLKKHKTQRDPEEIKRREERRAKKEKKRAKDAASAKS